LLDNWNFYFLCHEYKKEVAIQILSILNSSYCSPKTCPSRYLVVPLLNEDTILTPHSNHFITLYRGDLKNKDNFRIPHLSCHSKTHYWISTNSTQKLSLVGSQLILLVALCIFCQNNIAIGLTLLLLCIFMYHIYKFVIVIATK